MSNKTLATQFTFKFLGSSGNHDVYENAIGQKQDGFLRVLCIGDVVGIENIKICAKVIPGLKESMDLDVVLANGENSAADGRGITAESFAAFKAAGVDVITTGNHVWKHAKAYPLINQEKSIVRPLNFPEGCPGRGVTVLEFAGVKCAFVNLLGRVFIRENTACPFVTLQELLPQLPEDCKVIFVDVHAEASSEKVAMALHFDGRVSAIFGTHTHVQTADARVLPGGTGFVTDLGSVCSVNSCIGMAKEEVITGFLTQMPVRFKVSDSWPVVFSGAVFEIEISSGKCVNVLPIRIECTKH